MRTMIVLGDLNLDVVLIGMQQCPSFGKEILACRHLTKAGGSAANVAFVLAKNGCPVKLFSRIGNDPEGRYVLDCVREHGIAAETISCCDSEPTGITVSLSYPQERMYITHPGTVATTVLSDLQGGYLSPGDHLHLAAYFLQKAMQPNVGRLLADAKAVGMTTSLDPGSDPSGHWDISSLRPHFRYLDWFMPSEDEIRAIMKVEDTEESIRRFDHELTGLVVKSGSRGAMIRFRGCVEHFSGLQTDVIDPTCAGDCFNAGFLFTLMVGKSLPEAVKMGNIYGAQAVSHLGLPPKIV